MKYKVGNIIEAIVTGIENYGIFINTDDDYSGLIHISEISKNFVRNVNDYAKEGELIKAKIIAIDEKSRQLKLSIKDIDYRINKKNKGKIIETSTGFSTLKEKLPEWISDKEEELAKEELK